MRSISLAMITMLLTSLSVAQARRAMTINDLITAVRVSEPQTSPDGKQVVFTHTVTALETGRRNADIWTVPADASTPPRELIAGDKTENSPAFTPDGKHIAFISNRN